MRTPVEKLVGSAAGVPRFGALDVGRVPRRAKRATARGRPGASGVGLALRTMGYVPFVPPNVGGYPKGNRLLGPHQLVHAFDLLSVFPERAEIPRDVDALFARFGLFDVSDTHAQGRRRRT